MKSKSKFANNLKIDAIALWHSLFRGMASADRLIQSPEGNKDNEDIVQTMHQGGVFNDMLEGVETQQVVEMRDKYYRILKEADKYDASHIQIIGNPESDDFEFSNTASAKKKTKEDFMKHCEVYNKENLPIRTIQDNKQFEKHGMIDAFEMPTGIYDYDTTLTIERDGITPRIEIEKFATKIVVREKGNNRVYVELYLPTTASQFGKIDAILIANLYHLWESKNYNSDIVEFKKFKWFSFRAWNANDLMLFEYDDISLKDINIFDGSYVLSFDCNIINNGKDISKDLETPQVDEQYKFKTAKGNATNLFAIERRIKKDAEEGIDLDNILPTKLNIES